MRNKKKDRIFDPMQLSDDDLHSKIAEAYNILSRGNMSFTLEQQMRGMINTLQSEIRERAEKQLRDDLLRQGIDIAPSINITKD